MELFVAVPVVGTSPRRLVIIIITMIIITIIN